MLRLLTQSLYITHMIPKLNLFYCQDLLRNFRSGRAASASSSNVSGGDSVFSPKPGTPAILKENIKEEPINYEIAQNLRTLLFGSVVHVLSAKFRSEGLQFQELRASCPFGLLAEQNGVKGVLMCVQARIFKHLIFKYETREEIRNRNVLDPTDYQRRTALGLAIADILWEAGDKQRACLCRLEDADQFQVDPSDTYRKDGIVEKLIMIEFKSLEDLQKYISFYIATFLSINSHSVMVLLYSLILSRTPEKIKADHGHVHCQLLQDNEECSTGLINLLLSGQASPFLHNGIMRYDLTGKELPEPEIGVKERGDFGYLYWHRKEMDNERTTVGSMLLTPKKPIWITNVNGQFGILFCMNPELVGNWKSENNFTLFYFNGLFGVELAKLTVDTRKNRSMISKTFMSKATQEKKIPPLERCILSKWAGANISWNGKLPYI